MPLLSEIGEFGLIDRLRALDIVQGIGDDAAVLTPPPAHDLLVTTDALVEGVHFSFDWLSWNTLGWKSAAVNLSDLAAMGAVPAGMVLSLGFRENTTMDDVLAFYEGISDLLKAANITCPVVGGDITASPNGTTISVTAFGYTPSGQALRRCGAIPGDDVWASGTIGDSAAGLRLLQSMDFGKDDDLPSVLRKHLYPVPRVNEARAGAETGAIHAMIDLSDGLAGDLGHILEESRVGAVIEETLLPLSEDMRAVCGDYCWDPLDLALHGGEDYELLFTADPSRRLELQGIFDRLHTPITRIGAITDAPGLFFHRLGGVMEPLEPRAYQHF